MDEGHDRASISRKRATSNHAPAQRRGARGTGSARGRMMSPIAALNLDFGKYYRW